MKKKDGKPDTNGTKKNLQFVGVNGGWVYRALKSIISTFKGDYWLPFGSSIWRLLVFVAPLLPQIWNDL